MAGMVQVEVKAVGSVRVGGALRMEVQAPDSDSA